MRKLFKRVLILLILICTLTGCSNNKNEKNISDKNVAELKYVEDEIFKIVNKYAKGEYQKQNKNNDNTVIDIVDLDWDAIISDVKKINDSWDTILLDLSESDVQNSDLVSFSAELNNLIIITGDKNEKGLISQLNKLYTFVPKYLEKVKKDSKDIKKKQLKSEILASFDFANQDNWVEAKNYIQSSENKYKELMNDMEYAKENSYNLNKVYILIEELKNAISKERLDLVKLKYILTIEQL